VRQIGRGLDRYTTKANVVLTADLPDGDANLDGTILIEDAGSGIVKLVLYANGTHITFMSTPSGAGIMVTTGNLTVTTGSVIVT
jgi:hypothetical protein